MIVGLMIYDCGSLQVRVNTVARVSSLNIDRLEALAEALLDFKQVGDLEGWMGG
jgi:hypothetical protein